MKRVPRSKHFPLRPVALSIALLCSSAAQAQSLYWDINDKIPGAGSANPSGTWSLTNANWNTDASGGAAGTVSGWRPGANAVFSAGADAVGGYTVTVAPTGISLGNFSVLNGNPTLTGGGLTLSGLSGFNVAAGSTATLGLNLTGATGSNNGTSFALTKFGAGTLAFTDAATLNGLKISAGNLTVSGSGQVAAGALYMSGGASATVTGSGALLDGGFINLNNGPGSATLQIQNGAHFSNLGGVIGNATATVTGPGSVWTSSTLTVVAGTGSGTLNILDGARLNMISGGDFLVANGTTTGVANFKGAGTTVSGNVTYISAASTPGGVGTINIDDGAQVVFSEIHVAIKNQGGGGITAGNLILSGRPGSQGLLQTGSLLASTAAGRRTQGVTAQVNFNGGILRAAGDNSAFISDFIGSELNIEAGGAYIDSNGYTVGTASGFSGVGRLTKQGAGTLVLTGNNTYTGGTTIAAGALQLGNGGTIGSILGDVTNNGQLQFNRSDAVDFSGAISGSGTVIQSGTGTTTLRGANTYDGETVVRTGTLAVASDTALGSTVGETTVDAGATLAFAGNVSVGAETLHVAGNGDQGAGALRNLSGINRHAGDVLLAGDVLICSDSGSLTVGSISGKDQSVTVGGAGNFDVTRQVSLQGGQLIKTDSGAATMNGGGVIASGGAQAHAVTMNGGSLDMTGFDLSASGVGAAAFYGHSIAGRQTVSIGNSTLTSSQSSVIQADGFAADMTLTGVSATAAAGQALMSFANGSDVNLTAYASTLDGDIISDAGSHAALRLMNGSVLTGRIDPVNLSIGANSVWNIAGNSVIGSLDVAPTSAVNFQSGGAFKTLAVNGPLTGTGGSFGFNTNLAAGQADHISVTGATSGTHEVVLSNTGGVPAAPFGSVELIATPDGAAQFNLAGHGGNSINAGMYAYTFQKGSGAANNPVATNWYLVNLANPNTGNPGTSPTGTAVLDTAAAASIAWFNQLDVLQKRMGNLRDGVARGNLQGDVWGRVTGAHLSADSAGGGTVRDRFQGVDFGSDRAWLQADGSTLFTGVFAGAGQSDRDFDSAGGPGNGRVNTGYLGGYGTWVMRDGWYADVVLKAQRFNNRFDAVDASGSASSASYGHWGLGGSVEAGRRIALDDAWYIEPQGQIAVTHLIGKSYTTSNGIAVVLDGANVTQTRLGLRVGRNLAGGGTTFDPYAKINVIVQNSDSGMLNAQGASFKTQLDGTRTEIGGGLAYNQTERTQFHFDVERSVGGGTVRKDWELNLGLRLMF